MLAPTLQIHGQLPGGRGETPALTSTRSPAGQVLTSALGQSSLMTLSILFTTSIRIFSSSGLGDMYS